MSTSANLLALEFAHDARGGSAVPELVPAFSRLVGNFGISHFCVGHISPVAKSHVRGDVWAANPHPWFRHWVGRRYIEVDPLIWYLRRHQSFVRWSSLRQNQECPRRDIFDEASDFRLHDGLAFAVSLGQERIAALGLGMETYALGHDDEVALHLAVTYFATRMAQLLDHPPATNRPLTDRQRECLRWIAIGKSDWEASQILGISQATVRQHIKGAVAKLNAVTRIHAVAIAVSTNQIHL